MNFRKHTLKSGRIIFAGRNAENNDELVKKAERTDTLLHTEQPGSPFVNCGKEPNKEELQEAALFCAKHSQTWRDKKTDIHLNIFLKANMKKGLFMKKGTWNVTKQEKITAKKKDIEQFEHEHQKNQTP